MKERPTGYISIVLIRSYHISANQTEIHFIYEYIKLGNKLQMISINTPKVQC